MGKKILIAEDDRVIQELLQVNLELEGFDVAVAGNGQEALDRVAEVNPDLIILDIMMPKLDGWGTCTALKSDPKTSGIPVIFLSARAQELDQKRGFDLGVAAYVTKPFDPADLVEIVERVLAGERVLPSE